MGLSYIPILIPILHTLSSYETDSAICEEKNISVYVVKIFVKNN